MFLKLSAMESANFLFFFEMKEECILWYKISCVKMVVWLIVFKEGTNIQGFYIFDYGAEYGIECSDESGAK